MKNTWDNFVERLQVEDDCLVWTGNLNPDGYGRIMIERKRLWTHRYVWEQCAGTIPDGMEINHLCKRRSCVKFEHLEVLSHPDNVRYSRKTHCKNGHPFNETYLQTYRGKTTERRACRECRLAGLRLTQARMREERIARGEKVLHRPGQRTHCPQGHPYDEENTYINTGNGGRACRACLKASNQRRKHQREARA